jgi:hypothetical protein
MGVHDRIGARNELIEVRQQRRLQRQAASQHQVARDPPIQTGEVSRLGQRKLVQAIALDLAEHSLEPAPVRAALRHIVVDVQIAHRPIIAQDGGIMGTSRASEVILHARCSLRTHA